MAVPKQRHTRSRSNRRRSHIKLKLPTLTKCPHCNEAVLPHNLCDNCGYYRDKQVIDVLAKLDKKEKKLKAKELAQNEKDAKKDKPLNIEGLSKK
jgi:large subunit ribosomal protein L32